MIRPRGHGRLATAIDYTGIATRSGSIRYTHDLLGQLVLMRTDEDGNGTNDRAAFHDQNGVAKHDGYDPG